MATPGKGLEGVVAAETALSDIDGKEGRLSYVGYDIHDLVNATFEEVCYLLHHLELPNAEQLEEVRTQLSNEREPNEFVMQLLPSLAQTSAPMSMLRTAVSASSAKDPDGWDTSEDANFIIAFLVFGVFGYVF